MLSSLKRALARRREDEKGFTLIELMVVLLIMAILIAIAIPTYLGLTNRAHDRAAQTYLNTALTNADSEYANTNDYSTANVTNLGKDEPTITFVDAASSTSNAATKGTPSVSVDDSQAQVWTAAAESASGNCYYIRSVKQAGSQPVGTYYGDDTSGGACVGSGTPSDTAGWTTDESKGWG